MRKLLTLVILGACLAAFLGFNLGSLSSLKGDENYYFQVGRRMIKDADYVTPRYHHRIRFEKPPLYYWIVAGFFKTFGVSWRAARASSVTLAVLTLLIIYLLALELFGKKEALLSVLILATNEMFFRYSRLSVSDIAFLFFITLALFLLLKSYKAKSQSLFILSIVPMGLAALTKGPLGPVLIALVFLGFLIIERGLASIIRFGSIVRFRGAAWAVLVFLAVTMPWLVAMANIHGGAFLGHIWSVEIVDKALPGPAAAGGDLAEAALRYAKYFGYYVPVVLFSFLPWSLFLPFALFKKKDPAVREGNIFMLSWFWAVFIFFGAVGFKHTHYMLALSPALAMITACFLAKKPKRIPVTVGVLSIGFFLSMSGFILPTLDDGDMRVFSLKIATEIEEGDEIGMASEQFNIKKLGIHLNNLVTTPEELSGDDLARYVYINRDENLVPFLESDKRVFVLITESDYITYVPLELRQELYILETHLVWKKIQFNKELIKSILSGNLNDLKETAFLISNRG